MALFHIGQRSSEFRARLEQAQGRLYRMACAWCHDPTLAADLVQETSSKALERAGQLRDPALFESWLFRILANCCRDHFRRQRELPDADIAQRQIQEWTPQDEQERSEIVNAVRAGIASLPLDHRCVLTLVDLEGFSYDQVARILDIPIGTVMSRLSRARKKLKTRLQALGCDHGAGSRPTLRRVK